MDWNEYIDRHRDKYRDYKQSVWPELVEELRETRYLPEYRKALELKDTYINNEGYLANSFGLRHFLRANLYPSAMSDHQFLEFKEILSLITSEPSFYLPHYRDIYDVKTGNPFTQAEIIQRYIDKLDADFDNELPETLSVEAEYSQLKDIWSNYLEDYHRSHIKDLPSDQQKRELLKLSDSYSEYLELYQKANSVKDELVLTWISMSIDKHIKDHLRSQVATDEILDEIDFLIDIQERLPTLLVAQFNFDSHYFLIYEKYLESMGIRRGQHITRRRDWFKSQRWENCFPEKILPKLLADEQIVKQVMTIVKELGLKEYWMAKEVLSNLLEDFNLPPLRRYLS